MKVSAKSESKFTPHPPSDGYIRAVIVDVTEPKPMTTKFGTRDVFKIVYQTEMTRETDDGPKRWHVWSRPYTPSLHEKAALRKDIEKIIGRKIQDDEELDLEDYIGHPVSLIIEHKEDGDNVFAEIVAIRKYVGDSPLKSDGSFTRQKDRDQQGGDKGTYRKAESAPAKKEEPAGPLPWKQVKVHIGAYKGHALGTIPKEGVVKLITNWVPVASQAEKQSADDKRLLKALEEAAEAMDAAEPAMADY
jgi:hypothetical protein